MAVEHVDRSLYEGQIMADAHDWEILEKYGPGQENGLRNTINIDPDIVEEIARAHMIRMERPRLSREFYRNLRANKREAYMDGQAQVDPNNPKVPNGADIQDVFIQSRSKVER